MFNKNFSLGNLGSESTVVPASGAYFVEGKLQLPRVASGSSAPSSVIVTVENETTESTLYTSTAGDDGFYVDFNAAAGDEILVTLSSSDAVDVALNAVKCEVAIGSGQ